MRGDQPKEVRDGQSLRLRYHEGSGETLVKRQVDGLAQIINMNSLKNGGAAANDRHDPYSINEPRHLGEPRVLAGTQDQAGSNDQVPRSIKEPFERAFAPAIVGFRTGMGGRARDEHESGGLMGPAQTIHGLRPEIVDGKRLLRGRLARRVGAMDDDVIVIE